jgi:VWFA-related protein
MRRLLVCLSVVLAGSLVFAQSPQTPQSPTFRSTTSLVLVDVTVLDKDGKPVPGLTADDFQVKLDGQVRPVRAVTYEQIATPLAAPSVALEPIAPNGSPTRVESTSGAPPPAPRHRVIVIMVDDLSLTPSRGKGMLAAAARFVEALPPTDLVGYTTSSQSASMNPTPDHLAVQVALPRLVGQMSDPRLLPGPAVGIDEGIQIADGDSALLNQVIDRDCFPGAVPPDPSSFLNTRNPCPDDVARKARQLGRMAESTSYQQVQSYLEAVGALRTVPGLKQIILISDGLSLARRSQAAAALEPLAKLAAAAGVQVSVLSEEPLGSDVLDADQYLHALVSLTPGQPPPVLTGQLQAELRRSDALTLRQGVETVADLTGGTFYQVIGTADPFFTRIALATSAMYELGVEAPDKSAPGKDFALAVHVNRNGLTARANRHALVPEPAAPVPIDKQLNQAVASGTPLYGIPISLGTSIRRGESTSQLAVDLDVEIPAATPGPLTLVFGLADAIGLIQQGRKTIDAPTGGRDYRLSLAIPVVTGSYRMRLAVADANGALGSVETPVKAVLSRLGPFLASDLLTGWSPATGPVQFVALDHLPPTAVRLLSVLELYPDSGAAMPTDVRVKVTILTPDGTPIDERDVTPQNINGILRVEAPFDLQYIPAGPYVLRANVVVDGAAVGTASTTIRLTGPSGGDSGASSP